MQSDKVGIKKASKKGPSEVSGDGKQGNFLNLIDSYYDVIIPSVYAEETYYYEEENQRDLRTLYFNLV